MTEFIESPIYTNWLQKHIPSKKLMICSPFVVKNAIVRLFDFYAHEIALGDYELLIIIRAQKRDFLQGSSDIAAIEYLSEMQEEYPDKVKVRIVNNLHMKAYCVDDKELLVTSGNLTPRGLIKSGTQGNAEGGLATDEEGAIGQFKSYFERIFESGKEIQNLIESEMYKNIKQSERIQVKREDSQGNEGSLFYVQPPKVLLEYPESEAEDSRYKRFEIKNNINIVDMEVSMRDFIPQNADPENYLKTVTFLYENNGEKRSMERLAKYLGTEAMKPSTMMRKPSGILKNLKLLELIETERPSKGVLPNVTELGISFYQGNELLQFEILKEQSAKLPWMEHIRKLKEDNPDVDITQILTEYLCNQPTQYAESSAMRYRPAMAYFCKLNGII